MEEVTCGSTECVLIEITRNVKYMSKLHGDLEMVCDTAQGEICVAWHGVFLVVNCTIKHMLHMMQAMHF